LFSVVCLASALYDGRGRQKDYKYLTSEQDLISDQSSVISH
jgi:hypothetical protein